VAAEKELDNFFTIQNFNKVKNIGGQCKIRDSEQAASLDYAAAAPAHMTATITQYSKQARVEETFYHFKLKRVRLL